MWSSADSPALHSDVVYPPLDGRPPYILAIRAQALDKVQDLIMDVTIADGGRETLHMPTEAQWEAIVEAAFPPPPMA